MTEPDISAATLLARIEALEASLASTDRLVERLVTGCEAIVTQVAPLLATIAARQAELMAALEALAELGGDITFPTQH